MLLVSKIVLGSVGIAVFAGSLMQPKGGEAAPDRWGWPTGAVGGQADTQAAYASPVHALSAEATVSADAYSPCVMLHCPGSYSLDALLSHIR